MSRIIGVTLLLIILAENFYDSSALHAGFQVKKMHIRKCRCQTFSDGKIKCRLPLLPTNHAERQALVKCLCSKANQHKFKDFQAACKSWRPGVPLTLI